ncbi:MAG TPA: leucyl aminopeptidase [Bacteroidia bacterium]|nr:leucyl aminopeptidase [Bacteroidia bacterium]
MTVLERSSVLSKETALVILARGKADLKKYGVTGEQAVFVKNAFALERKVIPFRCGGQFVIVVAKPLKSDKNQLKELIRRAGACLVTLFNDEKVDSITIADSDDNTDHLMAFAEGILLGNYQFLTYKVKDKAKESNALRRVILYSKGVKEQGLERLRILTEATAIARDLVNEPVSTLNAVELSRQFQRLGKEAGFRVEVLNKAKITALKMGGLLGVNKGSSTPPTFTVMEYKPARPRNKKPIVLVGKGVVYDTGGYNLKTGAGMETMKCDMAGAAAVGATLWAIAKAKLPVHVIGLVPATDNKIGGDAYVAGDVLTMYNGLTVEMLNTDAEGRLILADALAYGEQYNPEIILEFSTLTGAAMAAIGHYGIVCMGTVDARTKTKLRNSGDQVHERLAEFPFWDEYDELLKSDVAELKNIGGPMGGAITAGKFLANFVKSPFMHFDIAGPAFLTAKDGYRPKGGTGVGVRLLFDYLSNY